MKLGIKFEIPKFFSELGTKSAANVKSVNKNAAVVDDNIAVNESAKIAAEIPADTVPNNNLPIIHKNGHHKAAKRWVLDISDPTYMKKLDVVPNEIPHVAQLKKYGWGKGPRNLIIRMNEPNIEDGEICFNFVDLYDKVKQTSATPRMLYVDLMQPELRTMLNTSNNIWNRIQTGAYAMALIVLTVVIALVIIILLGES